MLRRSCLLLVLLATGVHAETFVVCAGVEKYDDSRISSLKHAVADAKSVAAAFRASGVNRNQVTLLTSDATQPNRRPTRIALVTALQQVKQKARHGDKLIFFFAGHGIEEDGNQYLLTVDTRRDLIDATALPMDLVNRALKGLQASDVLFIVDACRNAPDAGRGDEGAQLTEGLIRGVRPRIVPATPEAKPELLATLLSCDVGQRAYEDPDAGHGVFTTYLLKGLAGEAATTNGPVELRQLAEYVTREVSDWAKRSNKQQTPRLVTEGDGDMVLLTPPPEPLVSVSFQRQPLSAVVELIAEQYGAQVVLGKGVDPAKTVSGHLENQPLGTVLKVLLLAVDLQVRREGKIYIIEAPEGGPEPVPAPEPPPAAEPEPPVENTGPVLVPQTGHGWGIDSLQYTPDGRWLITNGSAQTILWHADTLAEMGSYRTEAGSPAHIAISPDSERVAGVASREWWVWDIGGGVPLKHGRSHASSAAGLFGQCMVFEPDGNGLCIVMDDGQVHTWDSRNGLPSGKVACDGGAVDQVQFSPDGALLASRHRDGTVTVNDAKTGKIRCQLPEHHERLRALEFSRDNHLLVTASQDQPGVNLWDVDTGELHGTVEGIQGVYAVALSPDGRQLAIAKGKDGDELYLWDLEAGTLAAPPISGAFRALSYSPDGSRLACACNDGGLLLLDTQTGAEVSRAVNRVHAVWDVAFSPDGQQLAFGGNRLGHYWELPQAKLRRYAADRRFSTYPHLVFGADPDHLAFACGGQEWMLSLADDSIVWEHDQKSESIGQIVTDATSTKLAAISATTGDVWIRDAATGEELLRIPGLKPSHRVALSPDGRWLAAPSPAESRNASKTAIYDATTGRLVHATAETAGGVVCFSPDSRTLLVVNDTERPLRLVDVASGRTLTAWGSGQYPASACFSPDGKYVAVVTMNEHAVSIWDVETRQRVQFLVADQGRFQWVTYNPAGTLLATAGSDGSVSLWHAASGRLLAKLWELDEGDNWLITNPQGYYDGSPGGLELVRFELGGKLQPVGFLAEEFHQPEQVKRALAGELLD